MLRNSLRFQVRKIENLGYLEWLNLLKCRVRAYPKYRDGDRKLEHGQLANCTIPSETVMLSRFQCVRCVYGGMKHNLRCRTLGHFFVDGWKLKTEALPAWLGVSASSCCHINCQNCFESTSSTDHFPCETVLGLFQVIDADDLAFDIQHI